MIRVTYLKLQLACALLLDSKIISHAPPFACLVNSVISSMHFCINFSVRFRLRLFSRVAPRLARVSRVGVVREPLFGTSPVIAEPKEKPSGYVWIPLLHLHKMKQQQTAMFYVVKVLH